MARRRSTVVATLAAVLVAGSAAGRIKIDRYEPGTLPEARLWVSVIDQTKVVRPESIRAFSVYVNGAPVGEAEFETAAERGEPIAAAAIIDARYPERWRTAGRAIAPLFEGLPKYSKGFVVALTERDVRLPEEKWTEEPQTLVPAMRTVDSGGESLRTIRAVRRALRSFPLAPGLSGDPSDGEIPPEPRGDEAPDPVDRVMFVIGDGSHLVEPGRRPADDLRAVVHLARRRGVRVMAIGLTDHGSESLWVLRVLARKTGGTYRRSPTLDDLPAVAREAIDEVRGRYVLTFETTAVRPGDPINFLVRAQFERGRPESAREFSTVASHEMGWFARAVDSANDTWERWPWWARAIVWTVLALTVGLIVLVVLVKRARRRARERETRETARAAALAARTPCAVCCRMMMPEWDGCCMFCAEPQEAPMRFRLTGRSGTWAGEALRFDQALITIGSSPRCDLQVPDRGVASEHCGLRDRGGDQFVLTDFNTDTGTWVNGERISQTTIEEGDLLRVGDSEFVFGIEAG